MERIVSEGRLVCRRTFLKGAGAAAGAVAFPYVFPSTAFGAAERVTIGHIGVGGMGGGHLNRMSHRDDAQVLAVCDCFRSRREGKTRQVNALYARRFGREKYVSAKAYADFREVLARDDIDGVLVATTDHWHVPVAIAAARAGKDMYVEKPLGVAVSWNKAAREAVHRYGAVFQYGTQQRSSRHCRFGCELVRNGRIGELKRIEVTAPAGTGGGSTKPMPVPDELDYDRWLGPAPVSPYTRDRCTNQGSYHIYDNSLGFIAGWGAHPLDILVWGMGPEDPVPVEYEGTGKIPTDGLYNTITHWDVRCRYASGVEMTFGHGGDLTKFYGTEGWVSIRRHGLDAHPKSLLKSSIGPDEIHLVESRNQHGNFIEAIRTRATPVSNIDDAFQSDLISHMGDIAIRTGRTIRWDPKREEIVGDEAASRMLTRPMRSPWRL
jgi:predicted dehydrogenase